MNVTVKPGSPTAHSSTPIFEAKPVKKKPGPGIPRVAPTTKYNAPVHIDVGGTIYTSSLETLTAYPDSKLSNMFSGSIPIVLDTLKQHYFIDRDGGMFRHILNYLRNGKLALPTDFPYLDLLIQEAQYFEIDHMVCDLFNLKRERMDKMNEIKHDAEWIRQTNQQETDLLVQERDRFCREKKNLSEYIGSPITLRWENSL